MHTCIFLVFQKIRRPFVAYSCTGQKFGLVFLLNQVFNNIQAQPRATGECFDRQVVGIFEGVISLLYIEEFRRWKTASDLFVKIAGKRSEIDFLFRLEKRV